MPPHVSCFCLLHSLESAALLLANGPFVPTPVEKDTNTSMYGPPALAPDGGLGPTKRRQRIRIPVARFLHRRSPRPSCVAGGWGDIGFPLIVWHGITPGTANCMYRSCPHASCCTFSWGGTPVEGLAFSSASQLHKPRRIRKTGPVAGHGIELSEWPYPVVSYHHISALSVDNCRDTTYTSLAPKLTYDAKTIRLDTAATS